MALLESQRRISTRDLSAQLGVADASIRRDLVILEELGLLKRVPDGAVAIPHYLRGKEHATKMNFNREKNPDLRFSACRMNSRQFWAERWTCTPQAFSVATFGTLY